MTGLYISVRQFSSWLFFLSYHHHWYCFSFTLCVLQIYKPDTCFSRSSSFRKSRKRVYNLDFHVEVSWILTVWEVKRWKVGLQGMPVGRTVSNSLIRKCLGLGGLLFPERILRMRSVSCLSFCPGAPPWWTYTLWGDVWILGAGKGNSTQLAVSIASSMPPWDAVHYSITNFQDKAGVGSCHLTLDGWNSKGDSKQRKRGGIFNIYLLRIWKFNYTIKSLSW